MPSVPPLTLHRIAAGQCVLLQLPAGSLLRCTQGQVHIRTGPIMLADTVYSTQLPLAQGHIWHASQDAWLTVSAQQTAQLEHIHVQTTKNRMDLQEAAMRLASALTSLRRVLRAVSWKTP